MPSTVADPFVEFLVVAGCKRTCGIVDDSLNGVTDAVWVLWR
jgi:hypothetical protein